MDGWTDQEEQDELIHNIVTTSNHVGLLKFKLPRELANQNTLFSKAHELTKKGGS